MQRVAGLKTGIGPVMRPVPTAVGLMGRVGEKLEVGFCHSSMLINKYTGNPGDPIDQAV